MNRSLVQSVENPRRRIWPVMRLPEAAFHAHTRSTKRSRPRSWRVSPSAASSRSTTFWVAIPAWSVPGSHSTAYPCIRLRRTITSWSDMFRAWPMWRIPVTLGGGMTIENGSPSGLTSGLKTPASSQTGYQRASTCSGR